MPFYTFSIIFHKLYQQKICQTFYCSVNKICNKKSKTLEKINILTVKTGIYMITV